MKWSETLKKEMSELDWPKYYQNIYQSVTETTLRDFQYKILTRTIPTNKYLARCGLVESDKCWFCKENIETIEHLFWFCPVVKTFWLRIFGSIDVNSDSNINMTDIKVLLGGTEGANKDSLNFCFTVIKKYIYNTKCKEKDLSVQCCINTLEYYYSLEECVVKNDYGMIKDFTNRWKMLNSIMERLQSS